LFASYTGVIIRKVPQTGNGFILKVYTKEEGIKSFYVRKTKQTKATLMPLALVSITAYNNKKKPVLNSKELSLSIPFNSIYSDITKSNIVLFINELLDKLLVEEESNEALFDFIVSSLLSFDRNELDLDFHLAFLMNLSYYLGIKPDIRVGAFFDIENGVAKNTPPQHVNYFNEEETYVFRELYLYVFEEKEFKGNNTKRKKLIELLIQYYNYHFGIKNIKSLPVLNIIFN